MDDLLQFGGYTILFCDVEDLKYYILLLFYPPSHMSLFPLIRIDCILFKWRSIIELFYRQINFNLRTWPWDLKEHHQQQVTREETNLRRAKNHLRTFTKQSRPPINLTCYGDNKWPRYRVARTVCCGVGHRCCSHAKYVARTVCRCQR